MKNNIIIFLFLVFSNLNYSQNFKVNEILYNGSKENRINLLILGDGFTQAEIDNNSYKTQVISVAEYLFTIEPFKTYKSYFNVFSIDVSSEETGSTHPKTANDEPSSGTEKFSANTYFKSTYDVGGIHRLLVARSDIAGLVLSNNFPDWDICLVIVNHQMYGGAGGNIATTSIHPSGFEVAVHETGHSFAHLADEYEGNGGSGHESPNSTAITTRENIRWKSWIKDSTPIPTIPNTGFNNEIGLFEGAVYTSKGWYRPKNICKMRSLNVPFCEVCAQEVVLSIYNLLNIVDSSLPVEKTITISENTNINFSVNSIVPSDNTINYKWIVNENVLGNEATLSLNTSTLAQNDSVKVIVSDSTSFVRDDPFNLLTSETTWYINKTGTTKIVSNELKNHYSLGQNFPNPFNPSTKIKYSIAKSGKINLTVYDVFGREVKTLVEGYKNAGKFEVLFNAQNLASGIYFYTLTTNNFRETKKLILLK